MSSVVIARGITEIGQGPDFKTVTTVEKFSNIGVKHDIFGQHSLNFVTSNALLDLISYLWVQKRLLFVWFGHFVRRGTSNCKKAIKPERIISDEPFHRVVKNVFTVLGFEFIFESSMCSIVFFRGVILKNEAF